MSNTLHPGSPNELLTIDGDAVLSTAQHVSQIQRDVISEEHAYMAPVLFNLCTNLQTATPAELASKDPASGIRRGVGFAAAHRIVRLSGGSNRIGAELQQRSEAVGSYTRDARSNPTLLERDFIKIFDATDEALHRFIGGTLFPDRDDSHGCTNTESRNSARLMLILAGSVGTVEGQFIYERRPLPRKQQTMGGRRARSSGQPARY